MRLMHLVCAVKLRSRSMFFQTQPMVCTDAKATDDCARGTSIGFTISSSAHFDSSARIDEVAVMVVKLSLRARAKVLAVPAASNSESADVLIARSVDDDFALCVDVWLTGLTSGVSVDSAFLAFGVVALAGDGLDFRWQVEASLRRDKRSSAA